MRKRTCEFIKKNKGQVFLRKTGTLRYINIQTNEEIPSDVAEELDRLNKFRREFSKDHGFCLRFYL